MLNHRFGSCYLPAGSGDPVNPDPQPYMGCFVCVFYFRCAAGQEASGLPAASHVSAAFLPRG